jgi:bacterioferritin-associated ferredoxin
VYVCICHAVTDTDVRDAVARGDRTADEVALTTGASTGCGTCRQRLCAVVDAVAPADAPAAETAAVAVA